MEQCTLDLTLNVLPPSYVDWPRLRQALREASEAIHVAGDGQQASCDGANVLDGGLATELGADSP